MAIEDHFLGLPRPHPVLDVVDALVQLIIKASQSSDEPVIYSVAQISGYIFSSNDGSVKLGNMTLTLESLVHVLETVRRISGPVVNARVRTIFNQQQPQAFLNLQLLAALIRTDLLDWAVIDQALEPLRRSRGDSKL